RGTHDPIEDVEFLEKEITMWLHQILKRDWPKIARTTEAGKGDLPSLLEDRLSGLAIGKKHILKALKETELNADKPTAWSEDEIIGFIDILRSISKPMLIAANKIDIQTAEENVERLKELNYTVIPCCAEAELALRRAAEKKLIDYKPGDSDFTVIEPKILTIDQNKALQAIRENILRKYGSTGVQEAINIAFFQLLNMIVVYPVEDLEHLADHKGKVLPDAYIVPCRTTARQLAYIIHTELGESFIHAVEARERQRIGENHVLKDRDVISIVSAKKRG
ncbi:MAG: TGS domain-containing protein, partial [Candidatus Bathyarchaeota archaeon]